MSVLYFPFYRIPHISVTVTDLDRSIGFYRDILGLDVEAEILMEGPNAEKIFGQKGVSARVVYLRSDGDPAVPSLELIQFVGPDIDKRPMDLCRTGVSAISLLTRDIRADYERLSALGVKFISEPVPFDFTATGDAKREAFPNDPDRVITEFGKSQACYFTDPDGVILQLYEPE